MNAADGMEPIMVWVSVGVELMRHLCIDGPVYLPMLLPLLDPQLVVTQVLDSSQCETACSSRAVLEIDDFPLRLSVL